MSSAKRSFDGTTPVLTVTGSVVNNSDERQQTPQLRVTLKDEGGKEVQTWTDKLAVARARAGRTRRIHVALRGSAGRDLRLTVTFAPSQARSSTAARVRSRRRKARLCLRRSCRRTTDGPAAGEPKKAGEEGYQEPGWSGGDGGAGAADARAGPVKVEAADH